MPDTHDTHNLSLTDIPHIIRLAGEGVMLDTSLSRTGFTANGAILSSMMPHTARHTLVARSGDQRAVGQFYMPPEDTSARIVYLAPRIQDAEQDSAWLLVLDGMAREAGRRGAHTLIAELSEDSPLFVTMRQSGFAVYARQQIWMREPAPLPAGDKVRLVPVTESDMPHVLMLYTRTVPGLMQQVGAPPSPEGWVYYEDDEVMAFINVAEGRDSVYLMPYIDHRMRASVEDIILTAAAQVSRIEKRALFVRVRRYQGWMISALEMLGFVCDEKQAVMVRHIAAGVHSPTFAPLNQKLPVGQTPRRTERVPEVCSDGTAPQKMKMIMNMRCTTTESRVACDGMPHMHQQRQVSRINGGLPSQL